jgi:hypothetical protein
MEALIKFIEQYGVEVALIAFAAIFLVGVFKIILKRPLEKIEKANRKPIYEALSIVFAFGLTAAWLAVRVAWFHMPVDPFSWKLVGEASVGVYAAVKVMYPLYENFRLRDLLQIIGRWMLSWFSHKKIEVKQNKEEGNNSNGPTVI